MEKLALFLIAAVGDINNVDVLHQLQRKVRKQLRSLGVDPDARSSRTTHTSNPDPTPLPDVPADDAAPTLAPAANDPTPASTPPAIDLSLYAVGDEIVFGTANGEHTRAKVVKVNRKRLQAELLEARGRKKPVPAGTVVDVDPTIFVIKAAA